MITRLNLEKTSSSICDSFISVPDSGATFGPQIRAPDSGPGSGSQIRAPDSGPGFGPRIRAPDSGPGFRSWGPVPGSGRGFKPRCVRKVVHVLNESVGKFGGQM